MSIDPLKTLPSVEGAQFKDALAHVMAPYDGPNVQLPAHYERFGDLVTFEPKETTQLRTLKELIVRYVVQPAPPRPLCLSIFGPPGSGKSFAAKQIRSEAQHDLARQNEKRLARLKLPITIVNMTQVAGPLDVGRVLARLAGEQDEDTVPVIFIDEFDAPRQGARYGWLAWFLAPMHDGELVHEGAIVRLKRAVYVFAGGTADTLEEFSARQALAEFRFAKGPDFISRLRGFLNVQGPNAEPRPLRRALILRKEIEARVSRPRHETSSSAGAFAPNEDMMISLLQAGRYRHGARSIAALVEISGLTPQSTTYGWNALPAKHVLELHVDRGPLDRDRIGGAIAFSGHSSNDDPTDVSGCWLAVATALWREGATLAYGGSWKDDTHGGDLMQLLADELRKRPVQPAQDDESRQRPRPWLVNYRRLKNDTVDVDAIMAAEERTRRGLELRETDYLTKDEHRQFGERDWKGRVIGRFRQRLAISEASVARFAVGGKTDDYAGRMPGIVEEVMITLALKRPVYIAGKFGGAAFEVGTLLGLGDLRTGDIPESLASRAHEEDLAEIACKLQPPPLTSLPITPRQVASFLKAHAYGAKRWPDNGLSAAENRELFETDNRTRVAELVTTGLLRVFEDRDRT